METLVLVTHRNQYYIQNKFHLPSHYNNLPSKEFKANDCRSFESSNRSLPSPPSKFNNYYKPKSHKCYSEPPKQIKRSNPIAICSNTTSKIQNFSEDLDEFSYSELFAGPVYSNSPPPSSLPLPKGSLRQKRSVSLNLPVAKSDIESEPVSKSAPCSPTRESFSFATENLRRILHLDIAADD